jgi:hypothetical protein
MAAAQKRVKQCLKGSPSFCIVTPSADEKYHGHLPLGLERVEFVTKGDHVLRCTS